MSGLTSIVPYQRMTNDRDRTRGNILRIRKKSEKLIENHQYFLLILALEIYLASLSSRYLSLVHAFVVQGRLYDELQNQLAPP